MLTEPSYKHTVSAATALFGKWIAIGNKINSQAFRCGFKGAASSTDQNIKAISPCLANIYLSVK